MTSQGACSIHMCMCLYIFYLHLQDMRTMRIGRLESVLLWPPQIHASCVLHAWCALINVMHMSHKWSSVTPVVCALCVQHSYKMVHKARMQYTLYM